jgi:serine/threonine-protein kinase
MRLRLRFRTGHHQGQILEFDAPRTIVLGRSSQADVQIYDERISRRHCALRIEAGGIRLKDMGSGNGTHVNGAEIRETVVTTGDVLTIGRTEIELQFVSTLVPPTMVSRKGAGGPAVQATRDVRPAGAFAPTGAPGVQRGQPAGAPPGTTCTFCSKVIPADQLALAVEFRGRYLCVHCVPRVEVPGYQIEQRLGEGAMGVVYMAQDQKRGGRVALKVLKTRGELSEEDRARFMREGETASELNHPNIVRVIEHGQTGPYLYFVMEFVRGRSLKEWIDQHGPLPLPTALRIGYQVAQAMGHARQRHIVHRDIKPENILVQDDGHSKLADFGLAKNTMTSGASGLTRPGDGLGTLPYMPPEQIEDALFADHRSDVYSFGATMFHMLTGRPPFLARTPLEFFNAIRKDTAPPISSFRPDVPHVLVRMIEKCLAKDPEERYQQIEDAAMVIEQFLRTEFDSRQTAS